MTRQIAAALGLVVVCSAHGVAQTAPPAQFQITDNSFLVEEAFNQESGIFQNIFIVARSRHGGWAASFTQEWPIRNQRQQFSYTVPLAVVSGDSAVGDVLINYRFQAATEGAGRPAFSPRLSVVIPTSAERRPLGADGWGWQVNLPVSKRMGALYLHGNAGATWLRDDRPNSPAAAPRRWTSARAVAGSAIWAVRPMMNLMTEVLVESTPGDADDRETSTTVLPGLRTGWNFGDRQLVIGFGVPVTRGARHDIGVLAYVSYELPFMK